MKKPVSIMLILFLLLLKSISLTCMQTQINLRDLDFDNKEEAVIDKKSKLNTEENIYVRHNPEKVDVLADCSTIFDAMRLNFGITRKTHCTTTYFRSGDSIFFDDDTILKKLRRKFFEIKPKNSSQKTCTWYYRPLSTCETCSVVAGLAIVIAMFCKFTI